MVHQVESDTKLTRIFARTLARCGFHPLSLVKRQLMDAIERNDAKLAETLLQKNPEIPVWTMRNSAGRHQTLFETALDYGHFGIAGLMVKYNPAVIPGDWSKGEDCINRTILMQRCIKGAHDDEAAFLIKAGADVKAKDDDGNTALHFATPSGWPNSIVELINAGADVNAANRKGETPLMLATVGDSWVHMERLLNHGKADIAVCDAQGLNATMHALHNQNIKGALYLMEQGGKVTDHNDPAIERLRRVAEYEGEWDFIRQLNSQYDTSRNRQEELARLSMKEICEKGTPEDIKVRRIQLKPKGAQNIA